MTSYLPANNVSLYAVPAAFLLNLAPHWYRLVAVSMVGKWNNVSPRSNVERIEKAMTKAAHARLVRATGAHNNGLEMMPLFFAAVLAGNFAKLDPSTLNSFSAAYLLSRSAYTLFYIYGTNQIIALLRTLSWGTCTFLCIALLKRSADVVAK